MDVTSEEKRLVEYAKEAIVKYNTIRHAIVVADPVPDVQDHSRPPCGTCRDLIWSQGTPETTVILMQYIQGKAGWTFPKLEKYTIKDFYPLPYEPKEGLWDNWQPNKSY